MAHDIGHKSYHEGFQQPIGGSHEVDLRARQIQEAAERLSVSTDASGKKLLISLSMNQNYGTKLTYDRMHTCCKEIAFYSF